MSTGPFEFLFLQMVLQMLISADLTMIDLILLHILIKNYVLDKVWKDFGYDFGGCYVSAKISFIFRQLLVGRRTEKYGRYLLKQFAPQ